ncbi:MAG: cell division protein FtsQ/DivIB, partial [Solirubrobacterales bacterium]
MSSSTATGTSPARRRLKPPAKPRAAAVRDPVARLRAVVAGNRAARSRGRRPGRGVIFAIVATLLVLASASLLLIRDSSLVAVEEVRVVGLSGYYDRAARRALVAEAKTMTTINVDDGELAATAGEFVDVAGVRVESDLPHGLTIYVDVRRAVAAAKVGGRVVMLTGSGLILDQARRSADLPVLDIPGPVAGGRVTDARSRGALVLLGAAPDLLLRRVESVGRGRDGIVLTLDKGVKLIFGTSADAAAKWAAASAVLADRSAKGVEYIDLRVPERPAIGGLGAAPVTA